MSPTPADTPAEERDVPVGVIARLRDGGRPLLALLLLGALFKLLVMAAALDGDPLVRFPTSDSRYYLDRARGLAGIVGDPLAAQVHHLPPLYPQLLAHVPGAVEGSPAGMLALQHLAGLGLVLATWLLARRRASRMAALTAAALTLAYAPLTFFETRLLGDSLATAALVFAVLVCDGLADGAAGRLSGRAAGHDARQPARPAWRRALPGLLLGALLGAACLLRPQALLLAPVLALWSLRRDRWAGAGCMALIVLSLLPSALHNLRAGGDLVLVSDNGGINLWLAATGTPSGTFQVEDEAFGEIARQADESRRRAEAAVGHALKPGEVSRYWSRIALAAALADPWDQLGRVELRARSLVEDFETGIVAFPELAPAVMPPLLVAALPFGVLLALWGAARVLLAGRRQSAPSLPAIAVGAMVILTALAFFHYSRFRLPLVPLMAVAVGRGLDELRARRVSPARGALALALAAGLAAISWLPAPHHHTTLANGWTSLAEARRALASRDDTDALRQARDDLDRALAEDGGFVRAQLLAAELDLALGNWDGCARWLDRLETVLPTHPRVLAARGILAALPRPDNRHRDLQRARVVLEQLRQARVLDPDLDPVVTTLERLLGGG